MMASSLPAPPPLLAITNTPFDMAIDFAQSGRAIYRWDVMQAYLPHEIEPFYSEPEEFDSRDDWHCPKWISLGGMDEFYFLEKILHELEHGGGKTPR